MTELTTRMQKLYDNCLQAAQEGKWNVRAKLYNGEIKTLIKREKLDVTVSGQSRHTRNLFVTELSWNTAFDTTFMSCEQVAYATGVRDIVPKTKCFAERLYLETKRALYKKEN